MSMPHLWDRRTVRAPSRRPYECLLWATSRDMARSVHYSRSSAWGYLVRRRRRPFGRFEAEVPEQMQRRQRTSRAGAEAAASTRAGWLAALEEIEHQALHWDTPDHGPTGHL